MSVRLDERVTSCFIASAGSKNSAANFCASASISAKLPRGLLCKTRWPSSCAQVRRILSPGLSWDTTMTGLRGSVSDQSEKASNFSSADGRARTKTPLRSSLLIRFGMGLSGDSPNVARVTFAAATGSSPLKLGRCRGRGLIFLDSPSAISNSSNAIWSMLARSVPFSEARHRNINEPRGNSGPNPCSKNETG